MSAVLVARLDSAGDVLLAGPAIRAVAASAGPVTLLCGRRGRAAAELLPGVAEVLEWTAPWIDLEPEPVSAAEVLALAGLVERRFSQAVILTSHHQSALPLALVLRMAGIAEIAAASADYPGSLLDVRARPDDGLHEVERSLELVGRLGYRPSPDDDLRLRVNHAGPPPVSPRRPYVVLHPGAAVPARAGDPGLFADTARALAAAGWAVVVTGAAGERELTASVASQAVDAIDLGGRTSFAELAAVIAGAAALVVGNTGPAHLAAAVGTPVVTLYAPTVPAHRWRPWQVPHVLLGDQGIECAGCRARVCPRPGRPCLGVITVEQIASAVELLTRPVEAQAAAG